MHFTNNFLQLLGPIGWVLFAVVCLCVRFSFYLLSECARVCCMNVCPCLSSSLWLSINRTAAITNVLSVLLICPPGGVQVRLDGIRLV